MFMDWRKGRLKRLYLFAVYLNWTGRPPPLHSLMTLKRWTAARWGGRKEDRRGRGEERSRGTDFYIRPFISLLPSLIRNGRTLTPKHGASFHFHLARRNRILLQCPKRRKKNYSCTQESNSIVRVPVPTQKYSWSSHKDGLPSDKSYF